MLRALRSASAGLAELQASMSFSPRLERSWPWACSSATTSAPAASVPQCTCTPTIQPRMVNMGPPSQAGPLPTAVSSHQLCCDQSTPTCIMLCYILWRAYASLLGQEDCCRTRLDGPCPAIAVSSWSVHQPFGDGTMGPQVKSPLSAANCDFMVKRKPTHVAGVIGRGRAAYA